MHSFTIEDLTEEETKQYIAGCFDALRVSLSNHKRLKADVHTKNFYLALFLQDFVGADCKADVSTSYIFCISNARYRKIVEYCGAYIKDRRSEAKSHGIEILEREAGIKYWAGYFDEKLRFMINDCYPIFLLSSPSNNSNEFLNNIGVELDRSNNNCKVVRRVKSRKSFIENVGPHLIKWKHLRFLHDEIYKSPTKQGKRNWYAANKSKFLFNPDSRIIPKTGLNKEQSAAAKRERVKLKAWKKEYEKELLSSYKDELSAIKKFENSCTSEYIKISKQIDKIQKAEFKKTVRVFEVRIAAILRNAKKRAQTHFTCKVCNETKEKGEFFHSKKIKTATGLGGYRCKACTSKERSYKYHSDDKFREKQIEYAKSYVKKIRVEDPEKYKLWRGFRSNGNSKIRKVLKPLGVQYSIGRCINKKGLLAHMEEQWKLLPREIKEKHGLPAEMSGEEIASLRSQSIIHYDHIIPQSVILNVAKEEDLSHFKLFPNHYSNLRPLPAYENHSRNDNMHKLIDYFSKDDLNQIASNVFASDEKYPPIFF